MGRIVFHRKQILYLLDTRDNWPANLAVWCHGCAQTGQEKAVDARGRDLWTAGVLGRAALL